MTGRHIVITGATSGIGAELAKQYANQDIHLSLLGRNRERMQAVADACIKKGATVSMGLFDITDKVAVQTWLQQQDQQKPVDLLVVNAGMSSLQAQQTGMSATEAEEALVQVHMLGTLYTVNALLPAMQARKCGQIAIMSSMNAFIPIPRSHVYGAIKAALLHYGLALQGRLYGDNIKVNVICPGWVETALTAVNQHEMPFKLSVSKAAKKIIRGLEKNKLRIRFPWQLIAMLAFYRMQPLSARQKVSRKM